MAPLTNTGVAHKANGSSGGWLENRQLEGLLPDTPDGGVRLVDQRTTRQGIGKAARHALRVRERFLEGRLVERLRRHLLVSHIVGRVVPLRARASPAGSVQSPRSDPWALVVRIE